MPPITFETFDPTPYQRAPRGTVRGLLSLSQALAETKPEGASAAIDRTAAKLLAVNAEVEDGLTARQRESTPTDFAHEVEFDGLADVLWGSMRSGLELWSPFEHPAFERLLQAQPKKSPIAVALRTGRKKAQQARELAAKLFGTEGLAFTQRPYTDQSVSMAAILRLIDEDGLGEPLDEVVASELMVAVQACQPLYEEMIGDRLTRSDRKSSDLAVLRVKLQRAIMQYCIAVLAYLDEDEPETLEVVVGALQPIDNFRARRGGTARADGDGPAAGGADDGQDEDDEEDEVEPVT